MSSSIVWSHQKVLASQPDPLVSLSVVEDAVVADDARLATVRRNTAHSHSAGQDVLWKIKSFSTLRKEYCNVSHLGCVHPLAHPVQAQGKGRVV